MSRINNIFIKVAIVITAAIITSSCLEKIPGDYILEDKGMKSLADAEQTLTGVYSAFMSGSLYSGLLTLLPDIQADLVYAVQGNTNVYGNHWRWDIRSTNAEIEAIYGALYRVIGRCNFYLDQVEELRATLVDDVEIMTLDYYTGEVYCARAMAYSELIKCFCEAYDTENADEQLGVVLADTYFGEAPKSRSSLKQSYDFVLKDLKKAETMLDDFNDSYNAVYFTQASAHALHARVALYMKDWDAAIEHSSKLINRTDVFELASSNIYSGTQSYVDYMWTNDSSFEIIWKVGYTLTSYGGALGQVFLNYNTDYTYYYPDYVPAQWVLNLYASNDTRFDAYFASAQTGYPHQLVWPLLVKYFGNEAFIQNMIYHVNMPKPLRLAEQYLIRAEAYCQKGQYGSASADLSKLNSARYVGNASVSVNASNWLDVISNERVKELYMEGFRLQDLKRWGKGFKRTPQTSTQSEGSSLEIKADDPLFVWPIPKNELEAPGAEIQPNESNK